MKTIGEALEAMMPNFVPLGGERRTLAEAEGYHLAEPVLARMSLPPFTNSAMDGYAVRSDDVAGATAEAPRRLPVVEGASRAGGEAPPPLPPGSAMRIFTGAVMPQGANAVVIQENTRSEGPDLDVLAPVPLGGHVRKRGSDLEEGAVMLEAGLRIGPGELGLLASQRLGSVTVHRRPTVAILSTGDELRELHDPPEAGTIVNSNAYALAAQVREAGGIPWVLPNVPDDLELTVSRVKEALQADLLMTCGGVSVGEYDLVMEAFEKNGVSANFWKVRVKPGKPLTFGLSEGTPVVGLPGNPVSAMVTFEIFVRPGIRRMLGHLRPYRARQEVELAHAHRHSLGRPELARARVRRVETRWEAEMHRLQGSGSLPSMVGIDALVLLPADVEHFDPGTRLPAIFLRDEGGAPESPFDA